MRNGVLALLTCIIMMSMFNGHTSAEQPVADQPLANDFVVIWESPNPDRLFGYSPGIIRLDSGRLVVSMEVGGPGSDSNRLRIYTSDDGGITWTLRHRDAVVMGRPFQAGNRLYVLGHNGELVVTSSSDAGTTWTLATPISSTGHPWHQAPSNVIYAHDRVYLVMETSPDDTLRYSTMAPVVLSASVHDDLQDPQVWTFSNAFTFQDALMQAFGQSQPRGLGIPFFTGANLTGTGRVAGSVGWLESNLVQFNDPDHVWYDPKGRTYYLWMRANTGMSNVAAIAKAVEDDTGNITVGLAKAPSGQNILFTPMPGGHLKFHILHDQLSDLFWLLASESTDSMRRPDRLPEDRYGLPFNERNRLALYYSTNMMDWIRAGLVAVGPTASESRHYASMAVDGQDLVVVSRSGDERAKSAHDGNLITFHRIPNFRDLVSWSGEYPPAKVIGSRVDIVSPVDSSRVTGPFIARMQLTPSTTLLQNVVIELAGEPIYEGESLPTELAIDPVHASGTTSSLVITALTTEGERLTDAITLCIDTSWELRDEFLPPLSGGFLGTVDRSRTETTSAGWGYATESPELFLGDAHRRVVIRDGAQYLVWRAPNLHSFSVMVYAQRLAEVESISLDISEDGSTWLPIPYTVSHTDEALSLDSPWIHYELHGSLPQSSTAFFRVQVDSEASGLGLQFGEVILRGGVAPDKDCTPR